MKSRSLVGFLMFGTVALVIGGSAIAQQGRKQPSVAISANDLMGKFFSSF